MSRLYWTHRSRRDLVHIHRYIASEHPDAARKWIDRLRKRACGV